MLPCLQGEHQQQVLQAVERAKTVTMQELNAIIGVSLSAYNWQQHAQTHTHQLIKLIFRGYIIYLISPKVINFVCQKLPDILNDAELKSKINYS